MLQTVLSKKRVGNAQKEVFFLLLFLLLTNRILIRFCVCYSVACSCIVGNAH